MSQPDPSRVLDGNLLHMWNQLTFEAGMRGADPPAGYGWQQGLAPALPDGSYVVAPQYFFQASSGDDGLWVNNAIQQASQNTGFYQGALVRLLPVTYNFAATTPLLGPGDRVIGTGDIGVGTIVSYTGTGDCFRQTTTAAAKLGGAINNLTIDGTGAGAGSSGIHAGDIESLNYDRTLVQNFTGAGSIGYHFDNSVFWTERLEGSIRSKNNTNGVVFDVSGATTSTGSFARALLDIFVSATTPAQNGVVLQNGAFIYDGAVGLRGNFTSAATGTAGAALTLTGTVPAGHPGAGASSRIKFCRLDVGVEASVNTVVAQTINFAAAGNIINQCYGVMDWSSVGATMLASNNSGNLQLYNGQIFGDSTLAGSTTFGVVSEGALATGGTITPSGATVVVAPTAAVTGIILATGLQSGQKLSVINNSAFSITFAASGSNVAGGSAVVIAADTQMNFTWYGTAGLWFPG